MLKAAETSLPLCRRLDTMSSQWWFLGFHNWKAFGLSYLSLLQSEDLLHYNMVFIIKPSLCLYNNRANLSAYSPEV